MSAIELTVAASKVEGLVMTTLYWNAPPGSPRVSVVVDLTAVSWVLTSVRLTVTSFEVTPTLAPSSSIALTTIEFVHEVGKSPVWLTLNVQVSVPPGARVYGKSAARTGLLSPSTQCRGRRRPGRCPRSS